jgi:hypothetical protein
MHKFTPNTYFRPRLQSNSACQTSAPSRVIISLTDEKYDEYNVICGKPYTVHSIKV